MANISIYQTPNQSISLLAINFNLLNLCAEIAAKSGCAEQINRPPPGRRDNSR
jgi:hypothetical protein